MSRRLRASIYNSDNDDNDNDNDNDDDDNDAYTKSTIRVIAPATLDEGYSFDVLVEGNPYSVQVPPGGVKEGQEFDTPYEPPSKRGGGGGGGIHGSIPQESRKNRNVDNSCDFHHHNMGGHEGSDDEDDMTNPVQTMSDDEDDDDAKNKQKGKKNDNDPDAIWYDESTGAPIGRWRTSLCSCVDVITQSTFWMGMFCTPVLIAQLVTRLNLTWNGQEGPPEQTSLAFNRIILSMSIAIALWKIPYYLGWFSLLFYYLMIVVYVGTRVRAHVRQKYKIPAVLPRYYGGEHCDDGFCMLFCGCCSSIQMARHTHDDKEYPGHGCTTTGLGFDAPKIK